jgi:hypothetical protein
MVTIKPSNSENKSLIACGVYFFSKNIEVKYSLFPLNPFVSTIIEQRPKTNPNGCKKDLPRISVIEAAHTSKAIPSKFNAASVKKKFTFGILEISVEPTSEVQSKSNRPNRNE